MHTRSALIFKEEYYYDYNTRNKRSRGANRIDNMGNAAAFRGNTRKFRYAGSGAGADKKRIYLSEDEKKTATRRYRGSIMNEWYKTMLTAINSVIAERDPAEGAYEQDLIAKSDITEPENNPAE